MFEFVGVPAVFSKIGIFTWLKGVSSIDMVIHVSATEVSEQGLELC